MENEIFLEINGIRYRGFESISVSKSMEAFTGQFSFTSSVNEIVVNGERVIENPIKAQDVARIFIDDELIITGTVETLNISYDAASHVISVGGRDKTGDLVDSSAKETAYKEKSFPRLIEIVLKEHGFNDIKVINNVPDIQTLDSVAASPNSNGFTENVVTAEFGQSIFQFLDTYARKLQVLLTTDPDGNIVITREGSQNSGGALISTFSNRNNNILTANIDINTGDRFNVVEYSSQSLENNIGSVFPTGSSKDVVIRATRTISINNSESTNSEYLSELAKWSVNVRRAKGERYNCRFQGYYNDAGLIWKQNTLVQVIDDKCQLNGTFLIQGVTYSKSLEGSFTDLVIVNQGAFTLDVDKAVRLSNSNQFSSNLIKAA